MAMSPYVAGKHECPWRTRFAVHPIVACVRPQEAAKLCVRPIEAARYCVSPLEAVCAIVLRLAGTMVIAQNGGNALSMRALELLACNLFSTRFEF